MEMHWIRLDSLDQLPKTGLDSYGGVTNPPFLISLNKDYYMCCYSDEHECFIYHLIHEDYIHYPYDFSIHKLTIDDINENNYWMPLPEAPKNTNQIII